MRPRRPEYILCAAIWVNDGQVYPHQPKNIATGMVFAGRRHHNCFPALNKAFPGGSVDPEQRAGRHQGFLTSQDRFVERPEAAQIALSSGQIDRPISGLTSEDLYSEDLY